ncbi:MAG: hypothetical protein J6386_23025 [Candidatus Synoicihabitans palmerolidicus]|nr:hypothetical protein [Candidatus Synoicihabitans palmerolidicus]
MSRSPVPAALEAPSVFGLRQKTGAVLGPALLVLTWVLPAPAGMTEAAWATAGVAGLMATW